ncbi:hypothetical protein SLS57_004869 [Botryosphaeria dothidea]
MSQLLMCWFWGPYMLWYARNIQDTHFWSFQMKINVIAGYVDVRPRISKIQADALRFPGTPLWMAFLYSNDLGIIAVNRWFPHAGWFIPGIATIQLGSIIFPILDIGKTRSHMMNLEEELALGGHTSPSDDGMTRVNSKGPYSMVAFEEALEKDTDRLLTWTANHNYTAAEINFLIYVRNWKNNWGGPGRLHRMLTPTDSRSRYEDAAVIFFTFINPVTSRMTVNIDNKTYKDIAKYFDDVVAHDLPGEATSFFSEQEQVTPWEKDDVASQCQRAESFDRRRLQYLCEDGDEEDCETVPKGFSLSVFDSAYQIIKDDIFYNTWLRYVSDRETNSVTTGRSEHNGSPACMHEAWTPSPLQPAEAHMRSPRP